MRQVACLLFCLLLTACVKSSIDAERTKAADAGLKPMTSLFVFVESTMADSSKEVETVVAKELTDAGVTVQLGTAQLAHDAATNEIFAKADALGVDGALIVALESTGVEVDRNPMPAYVGPVPVFTPKKGSSSLVGQYSARLFDMRVKGKHAKVWQAKVSSRASNGSLIEFSTINDVTHHAARGIVSELAGDNMIARAER